MSGVRCRAPQKAPVLLGLSTAKLYSNWLFVFQSVSAVVLNQLRFAAHSLKHLNLCVSEMASGEFELLLLPRKSEPTTAVEWT